MELTQSSAAGSTGHGHGETDTRIGKLDFELGVPTKKTVTKLYDEMDYQRACQLYLWSFPIVAFANLEVNLALVDGEVTGASEQYGGQHHGRLPQIFWPQMVGTDSSNCGSDGIFGRDNRVQPRAELDPFSA